MQLDLIFTNATIYDGLGNPPIPGSIGIANGKIVFPLDRDISTSGAVKIDVGELAVSPGFINIHGHSDEQLLADGRVPSVLLQGITTEVIGNCGLSIAPLEGEFLEEIRRDIKRSYNMEVTWHNFDDLFHLMKEKGIAVNVVSLVGHGALRGSVMGLKDRKPTRREMERMKEELRKALRQGAGGFSTGLIYPPGSFAETEELIELASVANQEGGYYSTHIRGEGENLFPALDEAIRIGRESGISVEISHLKAAGEKNWGRSAEVLSKIKEARSENIIIQHDQYPYTASATELSLVIPEWAKDGGTDAFMNRLKDPDTRKKIIFEMQNSAYSNGRTIIISYVNLEKNKKYEGMDVGDAAAMENKTVFDFILDLIIEEEGSVGAIYLSMTEDDVRRIMIDPYTSIATDASASAVEGPLNRGKIHPRAYGSFPRVLGYYCRELKLFPLEEALRKMTSLPARMIGIKDRGILRNEMAADLVVFDPDKVRDQATFTDPHYYSKGIEYIVVNGKIAAHQLEIQPTLAGKVLKNTKINKLLSVEGI